MSTFVTEEEFRTGSIPRSALLIPHVEADKAEARKVSVQSPTAQHKAFQP
jgi:hypothetical protein